MSTAKLVDELWGEQPPETAVATVQVYISRLRKLLGEALVETRPTGYRLRLDPDALDLTRFESMLDQGRRLHAGGAARQADEILREALALWRGPPLADFDYEAFARNEIGRLKELRLEALELRLETDLAVGRHVEAIGELEGLVRDHPLRETLRVLLMTALYRAGRQADALAAYQDARAALVDDLGLDPGASLQQLEQAILRHDPSLDLVAASASVPAPVEIRAATRKVVTVLASSIVARGELVEQPDPELLGLTVARYFELAAAVVERHGGTVEKSVGDGVMAVFGVPRVREDDALRAVRAAVEIRDALPELGVLARIGVNTGEVVAGGSAAGQGLVTGDPVAVAKRLAETAAAGQVLIGEPTLALVRDTAEVEGVEPLAAKGKAEALLAYRLLRVREAPERVHRMRFVGRERELGLVREVWERVRAEQRCRLVTLVGPAGIGKSRLAAELLASSEALILRGRCLPYGEGITYWPVVEVLKQLELRPAEEAVAAAIRSLLGETKTVTSANEIAWAFRKTLEHAAAEQPLIVVFDDIHWGEDTFLDLVEHVALLSSGAPILLLCLARPELLERRPSWPELVQLQPLSDEDVEELIPQRIAGGFREKIARAAAGNPLFVEEMLAIAGEADGEVVVPPTLRALLAARIDRLDPAERSVLERGAIEGELFHTAAVEALAREPAPVERELAALVRKDLVRPERPVFQAGEAYRFRHLLIRDAAYDAIPKATRADLHERFANWLAQHHPDFVERDEIEGYHLEQSYRFREELRPLDDDTRQLAARAAHHLGAAGRRANDRSDVRAAINLLARAISLLPADSLERLELLQPYSYALNQSGLVLESVAISKEVYERATALGDRGLAAHARIRGVMFDLVVDLDEARAMAEEGIETFTELGDEAGLATAQWNLSQVWLTEGHIAETCDWLERALVHANASGDQTTRRRVTGALALGLARGPMHVSGALRRCEELREANRDDRVLEASLTRSLSELLAMAGRFDEARDHLRRSGDVLEAADTLSSSRLTQMVAASAQELVGDRAGAQRELEAMWLSFRGTLGAVPDQRAILAASRLANLYCDDGRWDDAAECLAFYRDVPDATNVTTTALRSAAAARVAAHRGELVEAVRLVLRAVEITESTDMLDTRARIWRALAEVQRAGGNDAEADAAVSRALELYEQKGNVAAAAALRATAKA